MIRLTSSPLRWKSDSSSCLATNSFCSFFSRTERGSPQQKMGVMPDLADIDLVGQHLVGLQKVFPAFAVTKHAIAHSDGVQHFGRNFTRKSAAGFIAAIL